MELLLALREAWADRPHAYVTAPGPQADGIEGPVHLVVNPQRNPLLLIRNALAAIRLALRLRPRVVVSTGANVAVPFCLAARVLGARLIFIETMARVRNGSLAGRMVYRFAEHFFVQWPELKQVYPRAELCRPVLLEHAGKPNPAARGTFVACGTHPAPFTRLLDLVDDARRSGALPEPFLVQTHDSQLTPLEVERAVRDHEVVVCHGGSGLISLARRAGKTPLVLPRRSEHGEHVDDHQVWMVEKLAEAGIVVSLDDTTPTLAAPAAPASFPGPALADRLRELL